MKDRIGIIFFFVLLMIVMSAVCSCRSSKHGIQTNIQAEETENTKEVKVSIDSTNLTMSRDVKWMKQWMNNFSFDFIKKETKWSAPDSTGKQHPTSTSETKGKASSESKGSEQLNDNWKLQYQHLALAIDSLNRQVKTLIKQEQTPVAVERKLSWWQVSLLYTGAIAWIVAIIGLAYWTNKRFNWLSLILKLIKL